jgi:hypothetical protein
MERDVQVRYIETDADAWARRSRLTALLALGVERLLRARGESAANGSEPVDLCPDLRVTSDGQPAGGDQE